MPVENTDRAEEPEYVLTNCPNCATKAAMDAKNQPQFSDSDFAKSSYCTYPPGGCVEVAIKDGFVAFRDAKNPRLTLLFSATEWKVFVQGVKSGEFEAA